MTHSANTRIDPILGVADVTASARWYQKIFGWKRAHGGTTFAVMVDGQAEVQCCLHQWGAHEHPTLRKAALPAGNGLLLYFCTDQMAEIHSRVKQSGWPLAEPLHLNPNANKKEFSLRDPDGYFWTVTEYHRFEG